MSNLNDSVTVIIRSVNERTRELCYKLILAQGVNCSNVMIIHESPFSAAIRKSFEIGIEYNLPWTLCVDADLLLRPKALENIIRIANEQGSNICEIQGYVLDKFFGGPRPGGIHLYRTTLLKKAYLFVPTDENIIRPEFYMLENLKAHGYQWISVPYLIGLHDFEQYYRDIFRKCFVQAHKHQYLTDLFLSIWRNRASEDMDFWVALQGFAEGIKYYHDVRIDIKDDIYMQKFNALVIDEKDPLPLNNFSLEEIENIINTWKEPEIYKQKFPTKMGLTSRISIKDQFINRLNEIGHIRMIPYSIGCLSNRFGNSLKKWCRKKRKIRKVT